VKLELYDNTHTALFPLWESESKFSMFVNKADARLALTADFVSFVQKRPQPPQYFTAGDFQRAARKLSVGRLSFASHAHAAALCGFANHCEVSQLSCGV